MPKLPAVRPRQVIRFLESHPCAQNAQGWGTLGHGLSEKIEVKSKIKGKGSGQECPLHTDDRFC